MAMPVYAILLLLGGFIVATVATSDFIYDGAALNGAAAGLALFAVMAMTTRWLGFARSGGAAEAVILFMALGIMTPLCAVILASTAMPLADEALARADALIFGFNRTRLVAMVERWPDFMSAVQWVYHSLMVQPFLLIAVLFGTGQERRAWTFVVAWGITMLITLAVFPFAPAVGSPPYFLDFLGVFEGARDGSFRVIGRQALTGIITFPSFHAAAAVLLAWGFLRVRVVAPPLVTLNILMFLSALIAGHYLVDLFAGAAVAIVAILLAKRIQDRMARSMPTSRHVPQARSGRVR